MICKVEMTYDDDDELSRLADWFTLQFHILRTIKTFPCSESQMNNSRNRRCSTLQKLKLFLKQICSIKPCMK